MSESMVHEGRIVQAGRWLTKRRGILLTPLFFVAVAAARWNSGLWKEIGIDGVGLLCLLSGIRLRLVAASYHESGQDAEPITAGPYAWVRHPLYLSNFLLGLGIVLVTGWWPMVVFYALFFLPLHLIIARSEEIHLVHLYGEKYAAYRRQVSAVLPWRRYPGPGYGLRSRFKLKAGSEWLKVAGYLVGIAGILLVKELRRQILLPGMPALPPALWLICPTVVLLAVIVRTKTRSSLLRSFQTVFAVCGVLLLAIHLPGIWPAQEGRIIPPGLLAAAPAAVPVLEVETQPTFRSETARTIPARPAAFWSRAWDYLEMVGGASAFGVATLVEREREEDNFRFNREMDDAIQTGVLAAVGLGFLKYWYGGQHSLFAQSTQDSWRFQIQPVIDRKRHIFLTRFKRKF